MSDPSSVSAAVRTARLAQILFLDSRRFQCSRPVMNATSRRYVADYRTPLIASSLMPQVSGVAVGSLPDLSLLVCFRQLFHAEHINALFLKISNPFLNHHHNVYLPKKRFHSAFWSSSLQRSRSTHQRCILVWFKWRPRLPSRTHRGECCSFLLSHSSLTYTSFRPPFLMSW